MASSDNPAGDDRPEVIPSEVDPDVECVRTDLVRDRTAAPPPPDAPMPPPSPASEAVTGRRLCPEGYTPRRRRRDYTLDGKRIVSDSPPVPNPEPIPNPEEPPTG
ncbi:hypothetical protein ACFYXM_32720 [Streptomyces sp. NPDC002476]|uniref:hypothetical protein n=1 Tax=Streptomyces sp. NPDC002476 TaxID=3364648 RepID=UPI003681287C